MKKMLDSKFLFILGLSILVLIGLGIGTFYLFDNSDSTFIKSGYVINPLSSKVEKYFFEEETSYRENLSSMIEFKDIDDNNVTILKDSFLHYNDGSMSFLKNGAILDLNSINGKEAVAFYNITNESIIEKKDDKYIIKTSQNDINFKNFMGRINDDKYIVAGNLELKIPGNNTMIKGDYFEIVYTENGIVNIENRENKYQVTAEGTYIHIGDILIDLGNKKITKGKEDIMSITAITINGDENIEIIPKAKEETTTKVNNGGNGNGNGNGEGNNGGANNENPISHEETTISENNLSVKLEKAEVTSTDITVKFDIENAVLTDNFSLRVIDLETGKTIEKYESIMPNRPYTVPFLNPSTKYLFMVVNESDNGKYLQKIIETNPLGISIEKSYATENELGYLITVSESCEATSANLILKKFNEETGLTETVKDNEGNDRILELKNLNGGAKTIEKFFGNLESDSIYTAVLTDFMVPPYNLGGDENDNGYRIVVTAMTLKKKPDFGNLIITKDKTESKFKLALSNIVDEDKAIRSYAYSISHYETVTNTENEENPNEQTRKLVKSIPTIIKNNASPIEIPVGEGEEKLAIGIKHYYKIVIEYFDNEKILEYIISDSDGSIEMEKDPIITLIPNDDNTSYNRIYGTIYLTDESCLLNNNAQGEDCSATRNAIVQIIDDPTGDSDDETAIVVTKNIKFEPGEDGKLQATLDAGGLEENKFYTVRVKAKRTDMPNSGAVKIDYSDESARGIHTKSLSTFYIEWNDYESNHQDVVNVGGKFVIDNIGEMTKEESVLAIKRVEILLYEGNLSTEIIENGGVTPIAPPIIKTYSDNFNIKEKFYDNEYQISSSSTFGLPFDTLASKSTDGKIQKYYTVYIRAYYNENGTKPITISKKSYAYRVDDALLRDDLGEMKITYTEIREGENGPYPLLHNTDTVIGYNVTASWETSKLLAAHFEPKKYRIYVYNENNEQVPFYLDPAGEPILEIYENISNYHPYEIYMNYGKETPDNIMRRGNKYYIGFEIEALSTTDDEGRISTLPINDNGIPKNRGAFTTVYEAKEIPKLNMFINKSTENSVTYTYEIDDPDNALYRQNDESDYGLYYSVNDTENILPITSHKDETKTYNHFEGNVTIPDLAKGDYYALYLKKDTEEGNYPNITNDTLRLFERKYNVSDYNFRFMLIDNEFIDNQVKIKILAEDEMISRIVNYKVTFTTYNNNEIDKTKEMNFGRLSPCSIDAEDNKCLIVDYQKIRNMKSKNIYVEVEAMYDTGLTGYSYTVGKDTETEKFDYPYMIMQGNNMKSSPGKYVSLTDGIIKPNTCTNPNDETTCERGNYNLIIWDETSSYQKGFYRYSFYNSTTINYTSYYAKILSPRSNTTKLLPSFTSDINGRIVTINSERIALNPKMLISDDMGYDDNTFSFSSYTPTINISDEVPMINGENITITMSGADYSEFCEESNTNECINRKENGTYKLYIDVWDNLEDVGNKDKIVRPTIEVPIDNNHLDSPIKNITIDKLQDSSTYYFRVYAWLKKNNTKNYTQLFDTIETQKNKEFTTKNYEIITLGSNNIFTSVGIKSILSTATNRSYGDRMINTEIKLTAYTSSSVKFNYDLNYVICDNTVDREDCKHNSGFDLLYNEIKAIKLNVDNNDKLAIESSFEHGKNYKVFVYAKYEYYDNYAQTKNEDTQFKEIYLGGGIRSIDPLVAPKLNNIDRNAIYLADETNPYAIEITPHVEDSHEVLDEGNYYVKLLSGNNQVGNMQIMIDGVYTTVDNNHPFKITDLSNQMNPVRFINLSEDTAYTVVVSGTANLNNYDPDVPIAERVKTVQTDPPITIYSTNENGVGFGKLEFTATEHSIVITFLGGSNTNIKNNIEKVVYTIGAWSNYSTENEEFYDETITFNGEYLTSEHGFTKDESRNPQYIISPDGMTNTLDTGYPTIVKFYLKDSNTPIKKIGTPVYTNKK